MTELSKLLINHSCIAVAGNRSTGKTMTALSLLKGFRRQFPTKKIAVLGVEDSLKETCERLGFSWVSNKKDILDLKFTNTLIFIAEFGMLFETKNRGTLLKKLERFFDRIEHNKCKLLIDTAREGFYNKFMCSRITAFVVKEIEYSSLVNGTWINEAVKNHKSLSDYRLQLPINKYVVVTNKNEMTKEHIIDYDEEFDSKAKDESFFSDEEIKMLQNNEQKSVHNIVQDKKQNKFIKIVQ